MDRRRKALILLLVIFAVGFLSGFVIGRAGGKAVARAEMAKLSGLDAADGAALEGTHGSASDDAVGGADAAAPGAAPGSAADGACDATEDSALDESSDDDVDGMGETVQKEIIYYGPRLPYAKLFADLNDAHLELARRVGLSTIPATRDEVRRLGGLVEIVDCDAYEVDDLSYSMPYLTRAAADELEAIGRAFRDSLRSKELLDYKIIVTSLLRTEEDVARLRRSGNPNASDNSAHCYATTFDIAYTRYHRDVETGEFMQPYELTKVLGEVLRERHNAGSCLIKYERKEHCFHITATGSGK